MLLIPSTPINICTETKVYQLTNARMKNPTVFSFSFILVFSFSLLCCQCCAATQNNSPNASRVVFDVGVILDLGTPLGKMTKVCISKALNDFYTTHYNYTTKLCLHWRDANQDSVDAASIGISLMLLVFIFSIFPSLV